GDDRRPGADGARARRRRNAALSAWPILPRPFGKLAPLRLLRPQPHGLALRLLTHRAQRALPLHPQLPAAPDLRPAPRVHVAAAGVSGLRNTLATGGTRRGAVALLA